MSLGHKSQGYCQRVPNREHPQPAWLSLWTWGLVQQRSVTRSRPDQASEEGVSEMVDVRNTDPPELLKKSIRPFPKTGSEGPPQSYTEKVPSCI